MHGLLFVRGVSLVVVSNKIVEFEFKTKSSDISKHRTAWFKAILKQKEIVTAQWSKLAIID